MSRIDEEGLCAVIEGRVVFAHEALDVVTAWANGNGIIRRSDGESSVVDGTAIWTDDVDGFGLAQVIIDSRLLVGVGVECDSALLLKDGSVVLLRTETDATEIASHGRLS